VVNGVKQSKNPNAVCAVMAAGNANDHRRAVGTKPLEDAIAEGNVRHIDLWTPTRWSGSNATGQLCPSSGRARVAGTGGHQTQGNGRSGTRTVSLNLASASAPGMTGAYTSGHG
jgi:hypothetical protein